MTLSFSRLACLAVFAVIALVACGGGPGAKAQPDPVKIEAVTFEEGETIRKIPLGDKFSGSELTYTAESNDPSVATVAVDNDKDILTVTAVGAGEATIAVTAADSQDRTASQSFKVTVKTHNERTRTRGSDRKGWCTYVCRLRGRGEYDQDSHPQSSVRGR